MDVANNIQYWPNGKKELESWNLNGKSHRLRGPAIILYYKSGKKRREEWRFNGKIHKISGPAIIWYYEQKNIVEHEYWFINDTQLTGRELIEYRKWLVDNNLYNKSYDTWTDEEKVLWRLRWI